MKTVLKKTIFLLILPVFIFLNVKAQIIITVAGKGSSGYSGDGGPATAAQLFFAANVTFDKAGNMFIADELNNVIRKVDAAGIISTVVGNGYGAGLSYGGYTGDNGPASAAELYDPVDVAFDTAGNLYIADHWNYVIRKVSTSGVITTVAGNGVFGYSGDGGPATAAKLSGPTGIVIDHYGALIIADQKNDVVRKVDTFGIITTIAGNGTPGYTGDNGPATAAEFQYPTSVALDRYGNLFISDQSNNVFRKMDLSGTVTTVAGNGTLGYTGDGSMATMAEINNAAGITVDSSDNIFLGDEGNSAIRKVNSSGIISTIAGSGSPGYKGDGGPATACELYYPWGAKLDVHGNIFVADYYNHVIRKIIFESREDTATLSAGNASLNPRDVQIYPNPTNGGFTVQHANGCHLVLFDMIGNDVYESDMTSDNQRIDIGRLATGLYLVRVIEPATGFRNTIKILKE